MLFFLGQQASGLLWLAMVIVTGTSWPGIKPV